MDNTKNQSKMITTCKTKKFQCYCYRRCSNTQFLLDSFLTRIQEDLLGVTDDFSFNATMHRCSHEQSCRESTEKTHCSESTDTYSLLLDQPQYCQVSIDNKYTVKRSRGTHNFHYYARGRTKGWSSRARGYTWYFETAMKRKWKLETTTVLNRRRELFITLHSSKIVVAYPSIYHVSTRWRNIWKWKLPKHLKTKCLLVLNS